MKRKFIIAVLVGLGILAAIPLAWSEIFPSGTWRYKMTVTVETPEGLKVGSAVRELHNSLPLMDIPDVGNQANLKGEAVVVDLGSRGMFFALLKGASGAEDHAKDIVYKAFPYSGGYGTREGIEHYSKLKGVKTELKLEQYPMLVMFKDINDSSTVTEIMKLKGNNPSFPKNELKEDRFVEIFGDGVKLKSITIEMTEEPVTHAIYKKLPWLRILKGGYLGEARTARNAPLGLHAGNFISLGRS